MFFARIDKSRHQGAPRRLFRFLPIHARALKLLRSAKQSTFPVRLFLRSSGFIGKPVQLPTCHFTRFFRLC